MPPVPNDADIYVKPGDLWVLGDHRLLCGDATDPGAVARLLDGAQPTLLATDPPYGVSLDPTWRDGGTAESGEGLKRLFKSAAIHEWDLPASKLLEDGVTGRVRHPVDFGLVNGHLRAVVHTVSFATDVRWALWQRAVLSEAAWDFQGQDVRFLMLYARAPRADREAAEAETASVRFVEANAITAVARDEVDAIEAVVASVVEER